MRVAIDYDGTWDQDPETFLAVALAFRDATGLTPKLAYMEEIGIDVDIWIDDQPEWIVRRELS